MPINGAVIKTGATAMSVTGGTDMTLSPDGINVQGGIHVANAAETDFRIRQHLTVTNKVPTLSSTGEYSKDKKSMVFRAPKILANGKTVINLLRVEREVHPESTAAEAAELNLIAGQLLTDSDFTSFWTGGNLS